MLLQYIYSGDIIFLSKSIGEVIHMLKFTAIGDFHYRKKMYAASVEDMKKIVENSYEEKVDFILHLGDLCTDYTNSPELLSILFENKYNIPVYGIMGNHELENNHTPEMVIPYLTNREVTFGEPIYNESKAAHWYTDLGDFRLIGLDTNFVYLPEEEKWYRKMNFTRPEGSILDLSLSPLQLEWLESVIAEAASLGKNVLVASHAPFVKDPWIYESPDFVEVQKIFAKYPRTVLLAMNGHIHTDNFEVRGDVAYFDVNTARVGCWWHQDEHHYLPEHTFSFTDYDKDGNEISSEEMSYCDLSQGINSWFFKDPLWAIVTVTEEGHITIKGRKTEWSYGIIPDRENVPGVYERTMPCINDRDVQVW